VIADDVVLLREGIARLLEGAGHGGTDDGLRAARQIREEQPETAVLVLSEHLEEEYALELLGDGADVGPARVPDRARARGAAAHGRGPLEPRGSPRRSSSPTAPWRST
jgi:hypothetical protein